MDITPIFVILKSRKRRRLQRFCLSLNVIPKNILLREWPKDEAGVHDLVRILESYNDDVQQAADSCFSDIEDGLKHNDIHCISCTSNLKSVIGLTKNEFLRLFERVRLKLKELFPHSPDTVPPGVRSNFLSRRMRLFMTLYRLKQGCSFRHMEVVLGWAKSTIEESVKLVLILLEHDLKGFHVGFLRRHGPFWQYREIQKWRQRHVADANLQSFADRILFVNDKAVRRRQDVMLPQLSPSFQYGSLGAVDGTFCPRPDLGRKTLLNNGIDVNNDPMYTDYKKVTAYKLVAIISHGPKKYILGVGIGNATVADGTLYSDMCESLIDDLVGEAILLGDHAFHTCWRVLCPYSAIEVTMGDKPILEAFNHSHSSDRMCSEHGMRILKEWGCIRGRTDIRLFADETLFKQAVHVCWGLHNWVLDGCPT